MILSASRRTDIPAFYAEWMANRLREGVFTTVNPYRSTSLTRWHISPQTVDCVVFWSKNPAPLLPFLDEIDRLGYRYCFQFTLTPYGSDLEPFCRDKREQIACFRRLAARVGKERVIWRYDPIVLNEKYTPAYHRKAFAELAGRLEGCFRSCTISFVDYYKNLNAPFRRGILRPVSFEEMAQLCGQLAEVGQKEGFSLFSCGQPEDLRPFGILPAACIDAGVLSELCGYPLDVPRKQKLRPACRCIDSVDMGRYGSCKNGCIYCYANQGRYLAAKGAGEPDPTSELLRGRSSEGQIVTEKWAASCRAAELPPLFSGKKEW